MENREILVTTALMPAYYRDFHCIMGACQDNCCDDGWKIEFSKKDYLKVKQATRGTALEEETARGMRRLRERMRDGAYAEFCVTETGRCAFHTPEGLCGLQVECGAETLPRVCRVFPRYDRYTLAARERGLSPACEGVLALLWDLSEGIDFLEEPLERKDWKAYVPHNPVAARFPEIRSFVIDVLQERSLRLSQRLLLLGLLFQQLREADWGAADTVDRWLAAGEALLRDPATAERLDRLPSNRRIFLSSNHNTLVRLFTGARETRALLGQELLGAVAKSAVSLDSGLRLTIREGRYQELEEQLEELLGHSEYFFENLTVAAALQLFLPQLADPEELWKSYVNLCHLYSLYRFSAVCGCDREVSRERLFHVLVQISRTMLHSKTNLVEFRDEFFQNDSADLAHMAILLCG